MHTITPHAASALASATHTKLEAHTHPEAKMMSAASHADNTSATSGAVESDSSCGSVRFFSPILAPLALPSAERRRRSNRDQKMCLRVVTTFGKSTCNQKAGGGDATRAISSARARSQRCVVGLDGPSEANVRASTVRSGCRLWLPSSAHCSRASMASSISVVSTVGPNAVCAASSSLAPRASRARDK